MCLDKIKVLSMLNADLFEEVSKKEQEDLGMYLNLSVRHFYYSQDLRAIGWSSDVRARAPRVVL